MSWQQSPEPEASSWWFARPHCRVISRQRCCDSGGEGSCGRLRSASLSCCMWYGCQSCCPFLCLFYTGVTCSEHRVNSIYPVCTESWILQYSLFLEEGSLWISFGKECQVSSRCKASYITHLFHTKLDETLHVSETFSNDPTYLVSYRASERIFWEGEPWNKLQMKSLYSSVSFVLPGEEESDYFLAKQAT